MSAATRWTHCMPAPNGPYRLVTSFVVSFVDYIGLVCVESERYITVMKSTTDIISEGMTERGVPFLLIGGMALPAFNVVRQTIDVDLLIATGKECVLQEVLIAEGYTEIGRTENFVRYASLSIYHADVDVLLIDEGTFEKIMAESHSFNTGRAFFKVPCAMHMIMLKLHAMKNNKSREIKDLGDIVEILRNSREVLDEKELDDICSRYGPEGIYLKIKDAL